MTLDEEIGRNGRVFLLCAVGVGAISTCADLWLHASMAVLAFDALHLGAMGASLWALSRPAVRTRPTPVLVAAAIVNYLATAAWAVVSGEPQSAILAFIAIALITATIIPWGML